MKIIQNTLLIFIITVILQACNYENEQKPASHNVEYSTIITDPTDTLEFTISVPTIGYGLAGAASTGPIFYIGRKPNPPCHSIGFCAWVKKAIDDPAEYYEFGRTLYLPIMYDTNNVILPIHIEFITDPTSLSGVDLNYYIDETFIMPTEPDMNLPFDLLRIEEAIVEYNPNIGIYGGYILNIEGIIFKI